MNNQDRKKKLRIKLFLNDYFARNDIKFEKKFTLPPEIHTRREKGKHMWFVKKPSTNVSSTNKEVNICEIKLENCVKTRVMFHA